MSQRVLFCHRGDIFGEQKIVTEGIFLPRRDFFDMEGA